MERLYKVLVIDDSAYIRKVIRQILDKSPFLEVVGAAPNGLEALEMVKELKPDVITCDLIMPEMDGVSFIAEQMKRKPIPIVVVSIASESGELALNALEAGAVSFIQKPTALATERVLEMSSELIEAVKEAAAISLQALVNQPKTVPQIILPTGAKNSSVELIVIGISTGGPQGLKSVIPALPADFPVPVAIVLHMPVGYTELYAQKLNEISNLNVTEAHEGDELVKGSVLLAPAGRHLIIRRGRDGRAIAHLDAKPFDTPHRPAVDVLFESAADTFGEHVLGIVMTGMGSDGKVGSAWIKSKGGKIITETEETCIVYGMPRSVVEAGLSDLQVPLYDMANKIMEII
jgi:two-component system chemotaxis response regulator CheB